MDVKEEYKKLTISLYVAAILWFVMFSPLTASMVSFWPMMTASAIVLTTLALVFGGRPALRADWREVLFGILIAVVLWGIFWVGDKFSQLLFSYARPQVDLIYGMKDGHSPWLLTALLLFIIGPAEEIFWRGYVQRRFCERGTANAAFLKTTAIYALVHLPSMNFMLIMAALVCGLVWGGLYRLMPHRLTAIVVSHALWDAAAFVWFPL